MVKDIPLTLYAHHAPVAVAHGGSGVHQFPAIQADITGRMDRTFVTESLVRKKAHGIVQTGLYMAGAKRTAKEETAV